MKRVINYIKNVINNPWILADDVMRFISFGFGLAVIFAFFKIFYALLGGNAASIINPNEW